MEPYSPRRARRLLEASDLYTAFLNFPREVRHYIYTNNSSESFNSYLDGIQDDLGGYFPSLLYLEAYLFVAIHRNNARWKSRPMSVIRHHSYHLRQLHAARFQVTDHESL
ncbi:MAG: hypothetical protein MjAS7_0839 [Metallosphaera javensis (ex Sakai et al. 2022)]|nr:MAG: hypothetical protein MjAS7_0839 [Metallosphaera javensis (ex Sakai et al. 2022)]